MKRRERKKGKKLWDEIRPVEGRGKGKERKGEERGTGVIKRGSNDKKIENGSEEEGEEGEKENTE